MDGEEIIRDVRQQYMRTGLMSGLATRQTSTPPAGPFAEPSRITRLEPLPTTITLDDGTVLEVHIVVGKVSKRLDKLDPEGRPAYDVEVGLRTLNVTREGAQDG